MLTAAANDLSFDQTFALQLERLARAGKIENKHEAVMVPKFRDKSGPPVLCIDFYRKLQRR